MAGTRVLLRGHYNPTNWTRKYPNLQTIKLSEMFRGFKAGSSVLICTQCIRTIGKTARLEKKAVLKAELAATLSASSGQVKAAAPAVDEKVEAPKKEAKPVKKPAAAKAKADEGKAAPKAKKEAK